MDEEELVIFRVIAAAGNARSLFLNAVAAAREGRFDDAAQLMAEGEDSFLAGHDAHAGLLTQAASDEGLTVTLMHVHAEDQLMCAEEFRILAAELIELYRRLPAT